MGEKYFNEVERLIAEKLKEFELSLDSSKDSFFKQIKEFLLTLDYSKGDLVKSVQNIKDANKIKTVLNQMLRNSGYGDESKSFPRFFKEIKEELDTFFEEIFNKTPLDFETEFVKYYSTELPRVLISGGVAEQFKNGVSELVLSGIRSGLSRDELTLQLKERLVDSDKLFRHASQVVEDTMNQFAREYVQTVSAGLGLNHYLYKGTLVKDSRCFCRQRVGRYFTEKEVNSWASLNWDGKIKTTNQENIKTNLGGWRCSHLLIPVSEELYNSNKALQGVNKKVNCTLKK